MMSTHPHRLNSTLIKPFDIWFGENYKISVHQKARQNYTKDYAILSVEDRNKEECTQEFLWFYNM